MSINIFEIGQCVSFDEDDGRLVFGTVIANDDHGLPTIQWDDGVTAAPPIAAVLSVAAVAPVLGSLN